MYREDARLGAGQAAQFAADVLQMEFHRADSRLDTLRELVIRRAPRQQMEHLEFPIGEIEYAR